MRLSFSCRALPLLLLAFLPARPVHSATAEVFYKPVPLNPSDPSQSKVGRLLFRGGLALTSTNPRFGGFSSLRLSEEGTRITSISDESTWLTAKLLHDERGFLVGVTDAEMGPLVDLEGQPLASKEWADAESLASMPDGSMIVGFEQHHRLWRYPASGGRPDGRPTVVPPPPGVEKAPENGGIESLVAFGGNHLFALTEYWIVDDLIRGWLGGPDDWQPLGYHFEGAYRPSDMATLPSGDVIVLERAYNPNRGIVGARLRRVNKGQIKKNAEIRSRAIADIRLPLTLDNFEGIDTIRGKNGETLIYLISDDNFLAGEQRTLLMMFALK